MIVHGEGVVTRAAAFSEEVEGHLAGVGGRAVDTLSVVKGEEVADDNDARRVGRLEWNRPERAGDVGRKVVLELLAGHLAAWEVVGEFDL